MLHAMYILYSSLLISLPEDLVAGLVEAMTAVILVGLMALAVRYARTPIAFIIAILVLLVMGAIFWRHSWFLSVTRQKSIKSSVKEVVDNQKVTMASLLAAMKKNRAAKNTKKLKAKVMALSMFRPRNKSARISPS